MSRIEIMWEEGRGDIPQSTACPLNQFAPCLGARCAAFVEDAREGGQEEGQAWIRITGHCGLVNLRREVWE